MVLWWPAAARTAEICGWMSLCRNICENSQKKWGLVVHDGFITSL